MRWRSAAAIVAALLLPVPLMLTLALSRWELWLGGGEHRLVPMLSEGELRSLSTYQRSCTRSAGECEPPLVCLFDTRLMQSYCTDSVCMTDMHCAAGKVCRSTEAMEGQVLRVCVGVGTAGAGERCSPLPRERESACAQELLCNTWCGQPCEPGVPESCPEGFSCTQREALDGPSCVPTCEGRTCPQGQECIRYENGGSVCAVVHGTNCQAHPCPEGQSCNRVSPVGAQGEVWMRCEQPCAQDGPACPPGSFCAFSECLRACNPQEPSPCGPGERCREFSEARRWGCVLDL